MYTVIGSRGSRAFRVLWMLEEIGQPYEHVPARPHSEEVRAVNPAGKVPCLRDGTAVLTDSVAIMTFLADRHGALTHPAGTHARARQDALTFAVLDEIEALLWAGARHGYILPEERRVPALRDTLMWEYGRNIAGFADALGERAFLTGDTMTAPDIVLTHCLRWAEAAKFPDPGPRLADYRARIEARDAFQRALARP